MVDMGWYASMQYSLNNLLRKENDETVLTGFYYGLWPLAKGNRFAAGLMESCFASDFAPKDSQWELWQAVALLEQLHSERLVISVEMMSPIFCDLNMMCSSFVRNSSH